MNRFLVLMLTGTVLVACADGDDAKGDLLAPVTGGGKEDAGERVTRSGALAFGPEAAQNATFTADLEFHGYELAVRPGAVVGLEITRAGSASRLDTTLFVFGPSTPAGGYGDSALAFDDDAGYGRLSKLRALTLAAGGSYLVVVGTHNGRGRGNYRLQATCPSGACAPLVAANGVCHPAFLGAIDACVQSWLADGDFDPSVTPREELIAQCADIEPMAPTRDTLCAGANAPTELCALDSEALALSYLPGCRRAAIATYLDGACAFGARYGDLFRGGAIVVVNERTLTSPAGLSALEKDQIVKAVRTTAYDDVATIDAAFAAVDEQIVNQAELWDASNRKAYSVYEVGAGDNSFGMIFKQGTTDQAARINDGDFYDCQVTWGPETRVCEADAHCGEGTRCVGSSDASPLGRCIRTGADTNSAIGSACTLPPGCAAGSGLVCAAASLSGTGFCQPAWMRARFFSEPALLIPDNKPAGATAQLLVYGLATVAVDVRLEMVVSHSRTSDLRVTLTNPAGTEVVVFDGQTNANGEIYFDNKALAGFPSDESVNGVWLLKAIDKKANKTGVIGRFGLELTSHWD